MPKQTFKIFLVVGVFFLALRCQASTIANFDFVGNDVTQGFTGWNYSDAGDDSCGVETRSKLCSSADQDGQKQSIYMYYNPYNDVHMGWTRWGYIDSGATAISGNSLKVLFTGGAYDNNGVVSFSGLDVKSKSQFDNYVSLGQNPYADRNLPGDFTLYFHSNNSNNHFYPFSQLVGNDRLSAWVLPPADSLYTLANQQYSSSNRSAPTLSSWYPFVYDSNGDHYYHGLANINMGGWIHLMFDAHPDHNNGGDTNPYSYYRAGGYDYPGDAVSYFNNVNAFALRGMLTSNLSSPAELYIDSFEAYKVAEPENDETIAGLGIGFDPSTKMFDIAFNDKYRCTSGCDANYEVRYSFTPITNVNYGSATLAKVTNFARTKNNSIGIVRKPNSGYNQLWAALDVADADKAQLVDGATIYFAVKDLTDRSGLVDRDVYDLETVDVPGVGAVRRVDLVKTSYYTIYPLFRQLYFEDNLLDIGHLEAFYSDNIIAKGGQKSYTFSLLSGNFPDGLTLAADGTISGIPTNTGIFNFRVNVAESSSFNQNVAKDFTINIYNPEICTDGIDNDADGLIDCADSDCYTDPACSINLVDFASPNIFGQANWNTLLKGTYTNYVSTGPGGTTITIGNNAAYDNQGVQGDSRNFIVGDKVFVYWYNDASTAVTFTPKISFDDNDRPGTGTIGTWNLMSEITIDPKKSSFNSFTVDQATAGSHNIVDVNVNYNNSATIICDKINLVPFISGDIAPPAAPSGLVVQ